MLKRAKKSKVAEDKIRYIKRPSDFVCPDVLKRDSNGFMKLASYIKSNMKKQSS